MGDFNTGFFEAGSGGLKAGMGGAEPNGDRGGLSFDDAGDDGDRGSVTLGFADVGLGGGMLSCGGRFGAVVAGGGGRTLTLCGFMATDGLGGKVDLAAV